MKRKIVMNVHMHNDKDKSKAMKIAVSVHGVISVSIVGDENNLLEIIGEGVDSVSLANSLRKKFPYTDIVSVEETKETNSPESSPPPPSPPPYPPPPYRVYNYGYPPPYYQGQYYDPGPPNCSII